MNSNWLPFLALFQTVASFRATGGAGLIRVATKSGFHPLHPVAVATNDPHFWSEYVLLRPSESTCQNSCEVDQPDCADDICRHVLGATCETKRVPGTLRTLIFSTLVCGLCAIPFLLSNPLVFPRLLEVAITSVVESF